MTTTPTTPAAETDVEFGTTAWWNTVTDKVLEGSGTLAWHSEIVDGVASGEVRVGPGRNLAPELLAGRFTALAGGRCVLVTPSRDLTTFTVRVGGAFPQLPLAPAERVLDPSAAIPIGTDFNGEPAWVDLAAMPNLVITGQTGSGKTNLTRLLVAGLLARGAIVDVVTAFGDVDYAWRDDQSGVVVAPEEGLLTAIERVHREMTRRQAEPGDAPRHVLVLDDVLGHLRREDIPHFHNTTGSEEVMEFIAQARNREDSKTLALARLDRVLANGARVGVHVILTAQAGYVEQLRSLRHLSQSAARVAVGPHSFGSLAAVFRNPHAAEAVAGIDRPRTVSLIESDASAHPRAFLPWFASPDDLSSPS